MRLIITFAAILLATGNAFADRNDQGFIWGEPTNVFIYTPSAQLKELKGKCIIFVESSFAKKASAKSKNKSVSGKGVRTYGFVTKLSDCSGSPIKGVDEVIKANDLIKFADNKVFDRPPRRLGSVVVPRHNYSSPKLDEETLAAYRAVDPNAYYVNLDSSSAIVKETPFEATVAGVTDLLKGERCVIYVNIPSGKSVPVATKYGILVFKSQCPNFEAGQKVKVNVSRLAQVMDADQLRQIENAKKVSGKFWFWEAEDAGAIETIR